MESLSWRFILSQTVKMKLCIARRITMTRGKLVLLDNDRVTTSSEKLVLCAVK